MKKRTLQDEQEEDPPDELIDVAKRFATYFTISGSLEWYLNMLSEML